jgi:AcrR family transcriptional regulator
MGITERKQREKADLKQRILAAARELFVQNGVEKTSIRNIAELIEYSPGTIYLHYPDKNAILHDLHTEGFGMLLQRMQTLDAVADPMERLKAMGRVYIQFAVDNPDMYDLMFIMTAPIEYVENKAQEEWNEGKLAFAYLRNTVDQCMERGHFKGHEPEALSFMIWATVHGICALRIRNRSIQVNLECPSTIEVDALGELIKLMDKA